MWSINTNAWCSLIAPVWITQRARTYLEMIKTSLCGTRYMISDLKEFQGIISCQLLCWSTEDHARNVELVSRCHRSADGVCIFIFRAQSTISDSVVFEFSPRRRFTQPVSGEIEVLIVLLERYLGRLHWAAWCLLAQSLLFYFLCSSTNLFMLMLSYQCWLERSKDNFTYSILSNRLCVYRRGRREIRGESRLSLVDWRLRS